MIAKGKSETKQSNRGKTVVASFSAEPEFLKKVQAAAELECEGNFSAFVTKSLRQTIEWKTNDRSAILRGLLSA